MTAIVDDRIRLPVRDNIVVGAPVRGFDMSEVASAANRLNGGGATLIPAYAPLNTIAVGGTATYRFKVWPQYPNLVYLWVFRAKRQGIIETTSVNITIKTPHTGSAVDHAVINQSAASTSYLAQLQTLTAQASSVADASVAITNSGATTTVRVEQIACFALPRRILLEDDNELGIDAHSLRTPAPIYDADHVSFGGLVEAVAGVETVNPRRCGLAHWAVDSGAPRVLDNGNRLFDSADGPTFLARKLYTTSTTGTVTFYAYCKTSTAATAGNLVVTADSGATANISIPINSDAAFAWFSTTLAVDAEDLTASDGRRSSRWDHVDVTFSRTAGAGTLSVASLCAGEA